MTPAKTPVTLNEIKERLNNSTNAQLGEFFKKIQGVDPFKDPKNRFLLPSAIRAQLINQVITWHNSGDLIANK